MQTFERVWSNARHVKISAITILVTLLKDVKEVEQFCTKWKLSNCERNLACFIVSHRFNEDLATDTLKPYQDLLVNLSNPKNIELIRENVRQLLYYHAKFTESEELDEWKIPKFPVTGGDLKELGIKPGPDFGKILGKLKTAWIESNFTLTKEFLMGQI